MPNQCQAWPRRCHHGARQVAVSQRRGAEKLKQQLLTSRPRRGTVEPAASGATITPACRCSFSPAAVRTTCPCGSPGRGLVVGPAPASPRGAVRPAPRSRGAARPRARSPCEWRRPAARVPRLRWLGPPLCAAAVMSLAAAPRLQGRRRFQGRRSSGGPWLKSHRALHPCPTVGTERDRRTRTAAGAGTRRRKVGLVCVSWQCPARGAARSTPVPPDGGAGSPTKFTLPTLIKVNQRLRRYLTPTRAGSSGRSAPARHAARQVERYQPLGTTAASVVPSPGALCTVRSPPASTSRSRIPTSP
jgi:hypothetical protein